MKFTVSLILLSTLFILFVISTAKKPHVINFRSTNLYPESFTWDPKSQHFIVGSTRNHHKIISVSDAGVVETLISDTSLPPNSSFLGLSVDRHNNRLLAVIHRRYPPFNAVASYDLQSRRRLFLSPIADETIAIQSAVAKDVAVDYDGNAYVTDSGNDVIWKVDSDGDVSIFSKSKAFKSHPVDVMTAVGLNGIVYNTRGYLLVVQSNTGKLFKVNVNDGTARTVTLTKDLTGGEGISVRKDGVVLVVSRNKLYFLKSNDGWGEGGVFDETALEAEWSPTAVTVGDEKRVYVLYGHVTEGVMGNVEREEFSIVEVESEEENLEEPVWLYILIGLGLAYFMFWRFQMHKLMESLNKKTV
ncbi:uncharacterized protein LOC132641600 [Lycium barbarum]|uniref:uncharacterized protein LOC132641600 n=1 Tax=Lycium barbarum TaxID=112863 RepID=UPI00293E7696|nr:uncharacterized protein LOC132641600 [Lycium barbarum]